MGVVGEGVADGRGEEGDDQAGVRSLGGQPDHPDGTFLSQSCPRTKII